MYKINILNPFSDLGCKKISKVRYSTPTHTNLVFIILSYVKSEKSDTKMEIVGYFASLTAIQTSQIVKEISS